MQVSNNIIEIRFALFLMVERFDHLQAVHHLFDISFGLTDGFEAVHRSDFNYGEVVDEIVNLINDHLQRGMDEVASIRVAARKLADQALWSRFIKRYFEAYDIALNHRNKRIN